MLATNTNDNATYKMERTKIRNANKLLIQNSSCIEQSKRVSE